MAANSEVLNSSLKRFWTERNEEYTHVAKTNNKYHEIILHKLKQNKRLKQNHWRKHIIDP